MVINTAVQIFCLLLIRYKNASFRHRRSTTGFFFFFFLFIYFIIIIIIIIFFFLHFHPFKDPYDMFMELFYL